MKLEKRFITGLLILIIISAFVMMMSSREENRVKEPISVDEFNATSGVNEPGDHNIQRFSDRAKQNNAGGIQSGTGVNRTPNAGIVPVITPKPLPYPRITIDYSLQNARNIRNNAADRNSTFLIVGLDIRNYGYKYFDAYPGRFRIGKNGDIEPAINVTTGNTMDAVIPNNSRAKGYLIFLLNRKDNFGKMKYLTTGSENYYIIYRSVSSIEDTTPQPEATNDDDI